jgi:cytochrome c6
MKKWTVPHLPRLLAIVSALLIPLASVSAQDAASIYKSKCAPCHGADGKGNTALKSMGVRDFASPEVQKETDDELATVIAKGRNKMPGYSATLKDPQIKNLVTYIRSLAKK